MGLSKFLSLFKSDGNGVYVDNITETKKFENGSAVTINEFKNNNGINEFIIIIERVAETGKKIILQKQTIYDKKKAIDLFKHVCEHIGTP